VPRAWQDYAKGLYFSDAKGQEGLNRFTLAKIEK
jgi:hypothetical protein